MSWHTYDISDANWKDFVFASLLTLLKKQILSNVAGIIVEMAEIFATIVDVIASCTQGDSAPVSKKQEGIGAKHILTRIVKSFITTRWELDPKNQKVSTCRPLICRVHISIEISATSQKWNP